VTLLDGDHGEVIEGTIIDITERKQAEEALAKEKALLRGLIDAVPDLIFYKDGQGVYLGCNTAFEQYVGRPEAAVVGRTDLDLFPSDVGAFFQEKDRAVLTEGRSKRNEE